MLKAMRAAPARGSGHGKKRLNQESARRPDGGRAGSGTSTRWRPADALLAAGIAAVTLLAYAQVSGCQFVSLDDPQYVTANPEVKAGLTWAGARWAFTTMRDGNWFPLTWLSHMAVVSAFGLGSGAHHLANLALHALSALLLFTALRRMTGSRWPSAFVALLFGIHPLHVESVAWVAERKDVLSALFWMLAFNGYASYVKRPGWRRYLLVAAPFALGLLSKSMIVTLPFVLLLLDVWPLGRLPLASGGWRRAGRLAWEKAPLLALGAAAAVVTFIAQQDTGAVVSIGRVPVGLRLANALWAYVSYLASFCWPGGLAVFYPYPPSIPWWQTLPAVAALAAVSAFAWRRLAASPYLAVGWAWYLGTLVPVIGLVQVGSQARADRYTYVPAIGVSIMLAWGAAELAARRPWTRLPVVTLAAAFSLACAVLTWNQVRTWRTSTTLFEHALAVTRDNFVALDGVGLQLRLQGRVDEAIGCFREAVRIAPTFAVGQHNLGEALVARGRAADALPHLVEAVRLNPALREARVSLAMAEADLGRDDEAIATYEEAVRLWPGYATAQTRLGLALAGRGRVDEGLAHLRDAVRLAPDDPDAHYNLARVLLGSGAADAGMSELTETLRIKPDFAEGHFNLGNTLAGRGRIDAAMAEYRAAIRLQPDFARAHANLGTALATVGRIDEAIAEFTEALRLQPDLADVRANLEYAKAARRQ
jgi:tetratricopeptide (TPR) repeat protein